MCKSKIAKLMYNVVEVKVKAMSVQAWTGTVRAAGGGGSLNFFKKKKPAHEGVKVVSPDHRPPRPH